MTRRIEINVNPFKHTSGLTTWLGCRKLGAALVVLQGLLHPAAMAQSIETSWFEIELLAFSRDNSRALLEQFPDKVVNIDTRGSVDLLSPLYQPDLTALLLSAPACQQGTEAFAQDPSLVLAINEVTFPLFASDVASLVAYQFNQQKFKLDYPGIDQRLPELCALSSSPTTAQAFSQLLPGAVQVKLQPPALLPITPQGQELHQQQPYLALESALQLKDLAYQLKHRGGHQLLIHTAWRQPLAGKRQAKAYRWYAGSNYGQQFDYFGRLKSSMVQSSETTEQNLLTTINALEKALAENPATPLADLQLDTHQQTNEPVWQLDGLIRVYSERMLFAETDFNLRRLSADGSKLSTYHSKDQSRLLIGEIHYLDHPHLGLVLQIRRFTPPLLPVNEPLAATTAAGPQ